MNEWIKQSYDHWSWQPRKWGMFTHRRFKFQQIHCECSKNTLSAPSPANVWCFHLGVQRNMTTGQRNCQTDEARGSSRSGSCPRVPGTRYFRERRRKRVCPIQFVPLASNCSEVSKSHEIWLNPWPHCHNISLSHTSIIISKEYFFLLV